MRQYGYAHSIFRNNKLINLTLHGTRLRYTYNNKRNDDSSIHA